AHAFDCLVCAEELKEAAIFLDSSRSVLRDDHPSEAFMTAPAAPPAPAGSVSPAAPATRVAPTRGWRAVLTSWALAPWALNPRALDLPPAFPSYVLTSAMLMLLGFTTYQNLVTIPALRNASTPRTLSSFSFVASGTRGATPMVIATAPEQPFLL